MSKDDVSLDDELLQVTEKKNNKKTQKKAKKDKSSKHEDEEEEEEELSGSNEDDSDHKNGKRKVKSESKKPLKKRKTDDSSSDRDSSDDEVYDDGWDEDLMGDDKDREWLASLPEIEREAILDERYQKRKDMREGWEVKRRLKAEQRAKRDKEKKDGKKESKKETRESKDRERRDRGTKKSESKGKALSELKKRRAKAGYKKSSDSDFDEIEEGEVEEEETKDGDYSPEKRASPDHETNKSFKDKEEEEEEEAQGGAEVLEKHPATFEEVEQVRLSRETLEKWMDKPFFDTLVPGFFVRIGIGMDPSTRMNVYRVAQVDSVETKSKMSYQLAGKATPKWLKLLIGDKTKEFKMETISNRPFTESEYKHWKMQMERCDRALPSGDEILKKLKTLAVAKDYRYTSDDIEKMLAEKKKAGVLPVKLAAEKAKLISLREAATDPDEKASLIEKINKLEEIGKERATKQKKNSSVLNINQRNREYNFIATLEAKVEERATNNDLDPFARRRTLPSIVFASKFKIDDEPNATNPDATTPPPTTHHLKTSTGSLTPASGKASEHDTIDIDIPFVNTPSAPFPPGARHPTTSSTPTPTTPPFVPEKEKKSTLSLTDYMRRRRALE